MLVYLTFMVVITLFQHLTKKAVICPISPLMNFTARNVVGSIKRSTTISGLDVKKESAGGGGTSGVWA